MNNNSLYNCILFKGLASHIVEGLMSNIFSKIKSFEQGDIIAYQDEEVSSLMIVLEGIVRGEMIDFSGKTIVIEEIEASRPLAPAFIFGKQNTYPVNIVSQTDSKILILPKDSFIKLLQSSEKILENYLNIISSRAQFLSRKLKFLSFHSIKGKFAYYLLDLAKNNNSNFITLPLSQNKLSELFGVTRPSLGRAIREMHNNGIIIAKGKHIQIINTFELYELMK